MVRVVAIAGTRRRPSASAAARRSCAPAKDASSSSAWRCPPTRLRTDHDRPRDGRRDRRPDRPVGARAAPTRSPPGRLPRADEPIWHERADLADDPVEFGDVQRLSASRKAVRMAGIDIGVHRSYRRARVGKLNRQGSPTCAGRSMKPRCRPVAPTAPTTEFVLVRGPPLPALHRCLHPLPLAFRHVAALRRMG